MTPDVTTNKTFTNANVIYYAKNLSEFYRDRKELKLHYQKKKLTNLRELIVAVDRRLRKASLILHETAQSKLAMKWLLISYQFPRQAN